MLISVGTPSEVDQFWPLVAPYLLDPAVASELGATPLVTPTSMWFVAFEVDLLGFCAVLPFPRKLSLRMDYTLPEHRGSGVYANLRECRDEWLLDQHSGVDHELVTRNEWQMGWYEDHGFERVGVRGSFTRLMRRTRA